MRDPGRREAPPAASPAPATRAPDWPTGMRPTHLLSRPCPHPLLVACLPPFRVQWTLEDKGGGVPRKEEGSQEIPSGVPSMQASPGTGLCPLPGSGLEPEGFKAAFVERGAVAQETWARGQQRKAGPRRPAPLSWVVWSQMGQFRSGLESCPRCAVGPQASLLTPTSLRLLPCNYMEHRQNYLKSVSFYLKEKKKKTQSLTLELCTMGTAVSPHRVVQRETWAWSNLSLTWSLQARGRLASAGEVLGAEQPPQSLSPGTRTYKGIASLL